MSFIKFLVVLITANQLFVICEMSSLLSNQIDGQRSTGDDEKKESSIEYFLSKQRLFFVQPTKSTTNCFSCSSQ